MKLIIQILLIFLLFISKGFGQTKKDIKNIKEKYYLITEMLEQDKLTMLAMESKCNRQTDTFLKFYYNNNSLVYMQHSYGQGHDSYTNHYYINDHKLIFYFSEYASWIWNYECAPEEQGFTNEIWTYEEERIYFNNKTPIKCLYKTYTERSVDQPYDSEVELSDTVKNKEKDCDVVLMEQVMKKYTQLVDIQKNENQNICDISLD